MKTIRSIQSSGMAAVLMLAATIAVFSFLQSAAAAPATATNKTAASAAVATPAPVPFEPPKSVFIWDPADPGFGRDPFFPQSPRNGRWAPPPPRKEVKPAEIPSTTTTSKTIETVPQPPIVRKEYKLDLSGIGGRRTAVINNISFLKGEIGRVNTPDGPVKIRLDEILGDSVRVTIWLDDGKTETRDVPLSGR